MKNETKLVDLEIDGIKAETDKAWCVVVDGVAYWLPKSQVKISHHDATITLPEWLAIEKELI